MSDRPISRFDVPDLDDLPDDIRDQIVAVQEKSGFVPNVFLAFARRPAEFRAFFAFHDALMDSNEGLSQVATNPGKADLSDRERHIVDFALKVATDSANVGDADLEAMRSHGFTDDEIWDIGAITALFALSNRYANFTGMRPNDEFYGMAR